MPKPQCFLRSSLVLSLTTVVFLDCGAAGDVLLTTVDVLQHSLVQSGLLSGTEPWTAAS